MLDRIEFELQQCVENRCRPNLDDIDAANLIAEIERLRADLSEQCRLLGMSGEREAKHLAQIERLERDNAKLRSVGIKMLDWLVGDIESGEHSGSDNPDDYELIVLAKETLTERGDQSSSTR